MRVIDSYIHIIYVASEAYEKISNILESVYIKKDVRKLSPLAQTSDLEGFHSLLNHFAPKMFQFGFYGMRSRYIHLLVMSLKQNE